MYFSSLFSLYFFFLVLFGFQKKREASFGNRKVIGKENREEKWKEIKLGEKKRFKPNKLIVFMFIQIHFICFSLLRLKA